MNQSLDKFGEFYVRNLRDKMLQDLDMLLSGSWNAPGVQDLQQRLVALPEDGRALIREVAEHMVVTGMHDLLFALQEEADNDDAIRLTVDGVEVAKESDGMHGEIFSDEGWIARFSQYPLKTNG
jgi:hypothetical protein